MFVAQHASLARSKCTQRKKMAASIGNHDMKMNQDKNKSKPSRYFQIDKEKDEDDSDTMPDLTSKNTDKNPDQLEETESSTLSSGRKRSKDPFEGPAKIPLKKVQKYSRGEALGKKKGGRTASHRWNLQKSEDGYKLAARQAARSELLLTEEPGFLEVGEGEETYEVRQSEIVSSVDIASATKHFELNLNQFGPYRMNFTRNGRHLALGGKMGHLTGIEWISKNLLFEINVMETITDIQWLHLETMLAVAQKKWLFIYDNSGIELHCIKSMSDVLRMTFLPYHFLLVGSTGYGALQYLDVSIGKLVAEIKTKLGRLNVMAQNPQNAVIHLGDSKGTVTLWTPNQPEPVVKMLCHRSAVRSIAVDAKGLYMATSGVDRTINIFDVRTYKPLQSYRIAHGANELHFSQTGLLAAASNNVVEHFKVFKDCCITSQTKPYMVHRLKDAISGLGFCPYEDVLGVSHSNGYASLLIPGAGEPNFDAFEVNPYMTKKQRKELEVKSLLEKIQPELISLDPGKIGEVDHATYQQRLEDKEALYGPVIKDKFQPRYKMKGKSKSGKRESRKQTVFDAEKRDETRKSVAEKERKRLQLEKEKEKNPPEFTSALDRFKKKR
ncbi:WD repeat-containing protein 46 [Holothuria leucospilota]|uniref:WD repeat-containing protein 46 n=1 Tax=Holothuria leucospilota TaxID=206669 RepID=A0A9Q0YLY0_HOLLE|nr:WD repeat-containing protein 46 [Holothuria leucospilota]